MPEKQAAKSLCQMHTAGKITEKETPAFEVHSSSQYSFALP